MNVIGIVQTDLNEFNILFEQMQKDQQQSNDQSGGGDDSGGGGGFSLFGIGQDDSGSDQGNQGQKQNKEQEMTVRIKGIPEGQKATFLQMYQIIQDAKEVKDIKSQCTVVSNGDQSGGGEGGSGKNRGNSGNHNLQ